MQKKLLTKLNISFMIKTLHKVSIEGAYLNFVNKGPYSQGYDFSRSHVWMWELDYKESWAPKNRCFWTVVLEKTLESPFDSRRSSQSILQEISPGCSLEGLMLKLKLPNSLATWCEVLTHWKRPWCWERLRAGGEGMKGWDGWMASPTHGGLHVWTPAVGDGQGGLVCCGSLGRNESDTTERLNWI